jgi:hypothetical protein
MSRRRPAAAAAAAAATAAVDPGRKFRRKEKRTRSFSARMISVSSLYTQGSSRVENISDTPTNGEQL